MFDLSNFLEITDDYAIFTECWFDRCIDRYNPEIGNYDYLPTYPYWANIFTPEEWIEEGKNEVAEASNLLIEKIKEKAKHYGIKIEECYFDENPGLAPKEESGYEVYTINDFLNLDYKEIEYEGYVYYGATIVKFNKDSNLKSIVSLMKDIIG